MSYTVWQIIIFLIGSGQALLSIICVCFPQKLVDSMPYLVNSKLAKYSDGVVRILLSISLILSASAAKYPIVFIVIGYMSLAAVVAIIVLGTERLKNVVNYMAAKLSILSVRLVRAFGVLYGAFLVYGIR